MAKRSNYLTYDYINALEYVLAIVIANKPEFASEVLRHTEDKYPAIQSDNEWRRFQRALKQRQSDAEKAE